jgi:hypothetical protein
MKRVPLMVLASVVIAALQLLAQSAWTIDPAHSAAQFQLKLSTDFAGYSFRASESPGSV